jgi:thymidylate kinase
VSPTRRNAGVLIAVEGLDGSGKSTQIHLLHEWLYGLRLRVHFTEWNSSSLVRSATRRGKKKQLLTSTTFSLIHATDFADRYERQILPMLRGGYIVLGQEDAAIALVHSGDGLDNGAPALFHIVVRTNADSLDLLLRPDHML